ncbi:hypothetical protein LC55x_0619 [Lysobacter capsici]|nr:hypothetical protein LC55x_0619 [Lysobacter capsici]
MRIRHGAYRRFHLRCQHRGVVYRALQVPEHFLRHRDFVPRCICIDAIAEPYRHVL